MIASEVDCKVYPYHPDCRGINNIINEGVEGTGAGYDQALSLFADDKAQVVSFISTNLNTELMSSLQSLVASFGLIG
ncbi:hypothetical protein MHN79_19705 [Vibrio sp. Of14-4]|uniref:hypothetical protein n=1 Tax=Vibrio sp. Of14-4 TaxID=2724878 RepID=UPI001EF306EA|nr:hypothetical protein [Vibrio sp. Of14-4]MCG7491708.1 hypothetical protein [Vibrio sp. Of14-4]